MRSMAGMVLMTRRRLLGLVVGLFVGGVAQGLSSAARAYPLAPFERDARRQARRPDEAARATAPLEDLLKLIPASDKNLLGPTMTDVDLAASRLGCSRRRTMHRTRWSWTTSRRCSMAASPAGGSSAGSTSMRTGPARRKYLAFGVGNIGQTALVGEPPQVFEVVAGRFDPNATDAVLSACAECAPPTRETYEGVPFYAWGDDFAVDFSRIFATRPDDSPRPRRLYCRPARTTCLAPSGPRGCARRSTPGSGGTVARGHPAGQRPGRRAEHAGYLQPLSHGGRDEPGCLVLQRGEHGSGRLNGAGSSSSVDPATLLRPYAAIALGVGKDDGGLYMTVASTTCWSSTRPRTSRSCRRPDRPDAVGAGKATVERTVRRSAPGQVRGAPVARQGSDARRWPEGLAGLVVQPRLAAALRRRVTRVQLDTMFHVKHS